MFRAQCDTTQLYWLPKHNVLAHYLLGTNYNMNGIIPKPVSTYCLQDGTSIFIAGFGGLKYNDMKARISPSG